MGSSNRLTSLPSLQRYSPKQGSQESCLSTLTVALVARGTKTDAVKMVTPGSSGQGQEEGYKQILFSPASLYCLDFPDLV